MNQVIGALVYWRRAMKDRSGATAIEYGIIAGGIAIVIIVAIGMIGGSLTQTFSSIAGAAGAKLCEQAHENCGN